MDRGAWWATVHGVAKSWTWLKQLSTHTYVKIHQTVGLRFAPFTAFKLCHNKTPASGWYTSASDSRYLWERRQSGTEVGFICIVNVTFLSRGKLKHRWEKNNSCLVSVVSRFSASLFSVCLDYFTIKHLKYLQKKKKKKQTPRILILHGLTQTPWRLLKHTLLVFLWDHIVV